MLFRSVEMHLTRRLAAPLVGVALAMTVAVAPAAAAPRAQPEPTSDICDALSLASQNLPDNPFIRQIWSRVLDLFNCEQNTV